jgi:hypothetical protein
VNASRRALVQAGLGVAGIAGIAGIHGQASA